MPRDHDNQSQYLETAPVVAVQDEIRFGTLVNFLTGDTFAIRSVARAKYGWLLGAILVLSAGFAREYNRTDLLAEPIHILIPFAASLVASVLFYCFIWFFAASGPLYSRPSYLEFLQCFWATAPLAWIYALPVERWCDRVTALNINYYLLEIVAVWRLFLMIRVLRTLWKAELSQATAIVLAFSDFAFIASIPLAPRPIIDIMAGVDLSLAEQVSRFHYQSVCTLAVLAAPILFIWLMLVTVMVDWRPVKPLDRSVECRIQSMVWASSLGAVIFGLLLCLLEQPAVRAGTTVNKLIADGKYHEAIEFLAAHDRREFSPQWELPIRSYRRGMIDDPRELVKLFLASLETANAPHWVKEELRRKVQRGVPYYGRQMIDGLSDEENEILLNEFGGAGTPVGSLLKQMGSDRLENQE
jgi:hypothetical protein